MNRLKSNHSVADIGLLLEGTYPYVKGGVSTWVDDMIRNLDGFTFHLFFIGAKRSLCTEPRYTLPKNVTGMTEIFLFEPVGDADLVPAILSSKAKKELYSKLRDFLMVEENKDSLERFFLLTEFMSKTPMTLGNLFQDKEAWEVLTEIYDKSLSGFSFIDFFWTTRFMLLPLWQVWSQLPQRPVARMNHAICTGYAGLIGALLKQRQGTPLLLTEHGIYAKERLAEINHASWIYTPDTVYFGYNTGWRKLREVWIQLFDLLGKSTYIQSDRILTLYEGNAKLQVEFGANPEIQEIIPNGINVANYEGVRRQREAFPKERRAIIGFIGRIVPIKDVETLLYSIYAVARKIPETELRLYGPTEEDEEYYKKCQELVETLGIEKQVRWMGSQPVREILTEIDLLVLTSISEGLPLVILEAFASAIPCVATDVGACRELLYGRTREDKALGRAGILTGISCPEETSVALVQLLEDRELRLKMGEAGRQRALRYYQAEKVYQRYRELYGEILGRTPQEGRKE